MTQEFTMMVPLDLTVSSNRTAERWKRGKVKDAMRALTRANARHLVPMGSATITVGIVKRTAGKYDPSNTSDTWKGMADELVDMGVIDADDWTHLLGPLPCHRGIDRTLPAGQLRAVVTLTEYTGWPFDIIPGAVSA